MPANRPVHGKQLNTLLSKLCIEWGFCIPEDDAQRIVAKTHLSAEEFASAVLEAEGMSPEFEVHWFRKIKRRFVEHFGADRISQ